MTALASRAQPPPNDRGGHDAQTHHRGFGRSGSSGGSGRLGRGDQPLAPVNRALVAWIILLAAGLAPALTGELTWHVAGRELYGERFVFVGALLVASFALWTLGRRSDLERVATIWALLAGVLAFVSAGYPRAVHQPCVWLLHLCMVLQLAAWWWAAGIERRGVLIMAAGMAVETFLIFPLAQLAASDPACTAGMRLTCVGGSPFVAMAVPALVTLALVWWWLDPLMQRLGGGRFRG